MSPEEMIAKRIQESGRTMRDIAAAADIPYHALTRARTGDRCLRVDEYLRLCTLLRADPMGCDYGTIKQ